MANDLVTLPRAYGAQTPGGTIDDNFAEQDAASVWQDSGEAEALALAFKNDIERYGAEQGKAFLLDHLSDMALEFYHIKGQVVALATVENAQGKVTVWYPVALGMKMAIAQAETNGDADMLRAVEALLRDVGGNFRGAPPAPAGTRQATAGRIRAPVAPAARQGGRIKRGPQEAS